MTLELSKRKEFVLLCFFYWSILVLKGALRVSAGEISFSPRRLNWREGCCRQLNLHLSELWFTVILNLISNPLNMHTYRACPSGHLVHLDKPKCGTRAGRFVVVPVVVCVIVPRTEKLQVREVSLFLSPLPLRRETASVFLVETPVPRPLLHL